MFKRVKDGDAEECILFTSSDGYEFTGVILDDELQTPIDTRAVHFGTGEEHGPESIDEMRNRVGKYNAMLELIDNLGGTYDFDGKYFAVIVPLVNIKLDE